MKILVTGASGQVGTEFCRIAGHLGELIAADREEFDMSEEGRIRSYLRQLRPDVIVNAGAYTAVDRAEEQHEICFAINAVAPRVLAEEAARIGAMLVHYSTDYVFDGEKSGAYEEGDPTAPLGIYGKSKEEGERGIAVSGASALVLRTSWVYSSHGSNFLLTMLRLAKERPELRIVDDQIGAPTSAKSIAAATARLVDTYAGRKMDFPAGIYHMTAAGATSWCGFAKAIFAQAELENVPRVVPIGTAEYPTPAVRPKNSVLSNAKFEKTFGFRMAGWEEQLIEVMAELEHGSP